jgi:hypothetical protein
MAYIDADWAGFIDDRQSTSGAAFYLGECLVSWLSKKQSSVSLSIAEAEYIATTTCCTQVLWMKETLIDVITLNCTTHAYLASGQLISLPCQSHAE